MAYLLWCGRFFMQWNVRFSFPWAFYIFSKLLNSNVEKKTDEVKYMQICRHFPLTKSSSSVRFDKFFTSFSSLIFFCSFFMSFDIHMTVVVILDQSVTFILLSLDIFVRHYLLRIDLLYCGLAYSTEVSPNCATDGASLVKSNWIFTFGTIKELSKQ